MILNILEITPYPIVLIDLYGRQIWGNLDRPVREVFLKDVALVMAGSNETISVLKPLCAKKTELSAAEVGFPTPPLPIKKCSLRQPYSPYVKH